MSEYVTVSKELVNGIASELQFAVKNEPNTDLPKTLIESFIEYMSEDLGCDHSVGICMCEQIGLVTELQLALEGKQTCKECGGDGFVWSEDNLKSTISSYAASHGISEGAASEYLGDEPGYDTCPSCNGQGTVKLGGEN